MIGLFLDAASVPAFTQVVVYEGFELPELLGWTPNAFCDPGRFVHDGWFWQEVSPCPGDPLPGGQQESFQKPLSTFAGSETFFLEWRAITSGPSSEILGVAPASMVVGGTAGYHFTFSRDLIRMIRTDFLPLFYYPLDPEKPHAYRLEVNGGSNYALYIDGEKVDGGTPVGPYPQYDASVISFRASCWYEPSVTSWDYVRLGVIPDDGRGDYNSDGLLTLFDGYFVYECLTKDGPGIFGGPGNDAGPGCRFADFDADGDVDLFDFAEFQNSFGA